MNKRVYRPGPKGSLIFGNLPAFGRDPLGFLERSIANHGDFVPLRFLTRSVFIVNDVADIESILVTNARHFRKTLGYRTPFMRRLFGQGLLTSEGDFWLRQRKMAQPAFHRDRVANYAAIISQFVERMLNGWRAGETRPIHQDMMRLTTEVVTRSLFNSDVPAEIDNLGRASVAVMERFTAQWSGWRLLLNLLPNASERRFREVMGQLDAYIYKLIRERRASGEDRGDLLSMLLLVRGDDGVGMSDQQLRDELTTLMVAGLDTTALALSWACYLLALNPAEQEPLSTEAATVLGGRTPGFADLPRLVFTEKVVKETMRLYPPAWLIGREAAADCEIGGQRITKGTPLIMSQWVKHRDARYFSDPKKFQPARWTEEFAKQLPKFAYFPFGGGPRVCIGASFAMMEAVLVLAAVAQKFRLTCAADYRVAPWPSITLQPRGGIHLRIERR